jgi:phosphopentomutase
MREASMGKDTTIGHWEIGGLISSTPLPTFPQGFPEDVLERIRRLSGREVLCNLPYSGTAVIEDYGREALEKGALIVYTSADSVFQIAAHEDIVSPEELYGYCRIARDILTGDDSVGRVIARPFIGEPDSFVRTDNRRDFSLEPPEDTVLDGLKEEGFDVISVGKINDIFAARGITEAILTHGNTEGMKVTSELLNRDFSGLCFVNLVDFDSKYGHRQDAEGYALAMSEFDNWLGGFIKGLTERDLLIITADHGCDPSDDSTDHTREYTPLLVYRKGSPVHDLGTLTGFYNVGKLVFEVLTDKIWE